MKKNSRLLSFLLLFLLLIQSVASSGPVLLSNSEQQDKISLELSQKKDHVNSNNTISSYNHINNDIDSSDSVYFEAQTSKNINNQPNYSEHELIIRFRDNYTNTEAIDSFLSDKGLKIVRKLTSGSFLVESSKENSLDESIKLIQENDSILYAEPNYLYYTSYIPDDTYYDQQWSHQVTSAEAAWDVTTGDSSTIIAIVDTGVDYNHPDLSSNIWSNIDEIAANGIDDDGNGFIDDIRGYDFVDNGVCTAPEDCDNRDNNPMDRNGHGTHCSGIAAASDNSIGIIGTCPSCKIMPVRAGYTNINGYGVLENADIADAIIYSADNGAKIISMSFGGPSSSEMTTAINYAYNNGVLLIAAAGNDGIESNLYAYPAALGNVISVAATDANDYKASFTNYGSWVDIAAPGVQIHSTLPGSSYGSYSGTSMATPYAAGLAGLIYSYDKEINDSFTLSQIEVKSLLVMSTDKNIDSYLYIGSGRVNNYKSLDFSLIDQNYSLEISSPAFGEAVSDLFDIIGTAQSDNFLEYRLSYGIGNYPVSFTSLSSSGTPIVDGTLFSDMDPAMIGDDDELNIRLEVEDSTGGTYELRIILDVNNLDINSPTNSQVLRAGDIVSILGNFNYTNYVINSIAYSAEGEDIWSSEGVTIIDSSGVIGTWDTSDLPESDFYKIKIDYTLNTYPFSEEIRQIYMDSTLNEGYPFRIASQCYEEPGNFSQGKGSSYYYTNADSRQKSLYLTDLLTQNTVPILDTYCFPGISSPVFSDIDNNPSNGKEIIVTVAGDPALLRIYDAEGSQLWEKAYSTSFIPVGNMPVPIVTDLEYDGFLDIIVFDYNYYDTNGSKIRAYNWDGTTKWSTNIPVDEYIPGIISADLDNNNKQEIILVSNSPSDNAEIYILGYTGTIRNHWEIPFPALTIIGIEKYPAVGNFDSDDDLEIVFAGMNEDSFDFQTGEITNFSYITVYNIDGSTVEGWPLNITTGLPLGSVTVGDIDNDWEDEIIVPLFYFTDYNPTLGGMYVYNRDGEIEPGWPTLLGSGLTNDASILDLDGDSQLEITVSSYDMSTNKSTVHILNNDGTAFAGWNSPELDNLESTGILAADISGDSSLEIIAGIGDGFSPNIEEHGGIYAFSLDGSILEGYPKVFNYYESYFFLPFNPIQIDDIDNDDSLELVTFSMFEADRSTYIENLYSSIYAWDLQSANEAPYWNKYRQNNSLTGYFNSSYYFNEDMVDQFIEDTSIAEGIPVDQIYLISTYYKTYATPCLLPDATPSNRCVQHLASKLKVTLGSGGEIFVGYF
ncbi:MAG: S8 family peptidase [Candidatus Dojkabacteria bacterium]|nr:S8 family peptidase [Candidatus Dojkabacteria bacterium]